MGRKILILWVLPLLGACATPTPHTAAVWQWDYETQRDARAAPDLALGPSPEHLAVAQAFNSRSDWPSVFGGYQFETLSVYTDSIYDDQFFYGNYDTIRAQSESIRTGVQVR